MENTTERLPIGSMPTDFSKLCRDCLKPDSSGAFAYRQAGWKNKTNPKLKKIKVKKCGGNIVYEYGYSSKTFNYCFYHAKLRGLLPWQKGKKNG